MFTSGRKHTNLYCGFFYHADSKFNGIHVSKTWLPTETKPHLHYRQFKWSYLVNLCSYRLSGGLKLFRMVMFGGVIVKY